MSSPVARPLVVLGVAMLAYRTPSLGQAAPALGSAASFAVLGASEATSDGPTTIAGNVGVSPGDTVRGMTSATFSLGGIYRNDALAKQAHKDSAAAYANLAARSCDSGLTGQNLGGKTLTAGVYCFASEARLTGILMLDAGGNRDTVWIFQVKGTLIVDAGASVVVTNGGYDGNVFWQVGASATIGERSGFRGSILALTDITLNEGATLSGRALTQQGAVRLHGNDLSVCCQPIPVAPSTLSNAVEGDAYVQRLTATGGTNAFTFELASAPAWLSLQGDVLSGTAVAGVYTFTVIARDNVTRCTGQQTYTVTVCPKLTIDNLTLPDGTARVPYSVPIAVSGSDSYTLDATANPAWALSITGNVLSGTPPRSGLYDITVTATDTVTRCFVSRTYRVNVASNCGSLAILTPSLLPGRVGKPYSKTIAAGGGTEPYTFSVTGDLPPGLLPYANGTVSGIPTTPGTYCFTATVTDADNCTTSHDFCVDISCPTIDLSPETLAVAIAGQDYEHAFIVASGGTPPYTFTVIPPVLPNALVAITVNDTTLQIKGTPAAAGVVAFTVTATDSYGCVLIQPYQVIVKAAAVSTDVPTLSPWAMLALLLLLGATALVTLGKGGG
jgi:hypothetical protein